MIPIMIKDKEHIKQFTMKLINQWDQETEFKNKPTWNEIW